MRGSRIGLQSVLIGASVMALGCGSSGSGGSAAGAAGVSANGGNPASGGSSATGGATSTGGSSNTGGSTPSGGSSSSGGATASGGSSNTGGATASGGNPGTGGIPSVVHPCSDLPKTSQWELITPPGDVGDSQDVRVHPTESGTIYVGMHKGGNGAHYPTDGLYKSTDCGATWLPRISVGKNGDAFGQGSLWSFAIDPVDPNVMFGVTGYGAGGIWKTTNGGVDWENSVPDSVGQYVPSGFFQVLAMDPTDRHHVVATAHVNCTGPYGPNSCLAETTDSGATWRLIKVAWGWAEGAGPYAFNDKTIGVGVPFSGLMLSTDSGATWKKVTDNASGLIYQASNGDYFTGSGNGVYHSTDGLTWSMLAGSFGRTVSFAGSDVNVYAADQWARGYRMAPLSDLTKWTSLTTSGMPNDNQGAPFMDYDQGHHILYSSNFAGGLWRIVTP